jgi:hypothetical protein
MSKQKSLCKLSQTYGVLSDSSWIEARQSDNGFTVTLWVEEIFPDPKDIGNVHERYNWKLFCNYLMKLCDSALEVQPQERDAWQSIAVKGEAGLAADCLRIAWANANDQDSVLNWLLSLDEESFRFIDTNFKIIQVPGDYDLLDEVLDLLQSTGHDTNIFKVLESVGLVQSRDSIRELVDVLADRKSEQQEQKGRIRKRAIESFNRKIEEISNRFSDESRRIGAGISGSKPSIRSIVRRWLEDYVVEHGFMPDGAHEVSVPFLGGRISAGTIDFSDLPGIE